MYLETHTNCRSKQYYQDYRALKIRSTGKAGGAKWTWRETEQRKDDDDEDEEVHSYGGAVLYVPDGARTEKGVGRQLARVYTTALCSRRPRTASALAVPPGEVNVSICPDTSPRLSISYLALPLFKLIFFFFFFLFLCVFFFFLSLTRSGSLRLSISYLASPLFELIFFVFFFLFFFLFFSVLFSVAGSLRLSWSLDRELLAPPLVERACPGEPPTLDGIMTLRHRGPQSGVRALTGAAPFLPATTSGLIFKCSTAIIRQPRVSVSHFCDKCPLARNASSRYKNAGDNPAAFVLLENDFSPPSDA